MRCSVSNKYWGGANKINTRQMPKTIFSTGRQQRAASTLWPSTILQLKKVPRRRLFPSDIMHNYIAILKFPKVKKKVAKVQSTVAFINHMIYSIMEAWWGPFYMKGWHFHYNRCQPWTCVNLLLLVPIFSPEPSWFGSVLGVLGGPNQFLGHF